MIYCCDHCGFLFARRGEVLECPSCEGKRIRPATREEAERLQALLVNDICMKHREEETA